MSDYRVILPPCPPWCTLPAGHPYTDVDTVTGQMGRGHDAEGHSTEGGYNSVQVGASAWETVNADGSVVVVASVGVEAPSVTVTAAEARQVAAWLLDAADTIDPPDVSTGHRSVAS